MVAPRSKRQLYGRKLPSVMLLPKRTKTQPDPEKALYQLESLLDRHKLTLPFPPNPEAFVNSLIPTMQSTDPAPEQLENLNLALTLRQFVHVSIDEHSKFLRGDYESVFWLRVPIDIPTPPDILQPFRLWPTHSQWGPVTAWFEEATQLDNKIDNIKEGLKHFFKTVESAASMRVAWPELTQFVRLRGPMMAHVPSMQKQAINLMLRDYIDADFKKTTLQMLAAATLLDAEAEPLAWVSFHTE